MEYNTVSIRKIIFARVRERERVSLSQEREINIRKTNNTHSSERNTHE
jgi:hypothetical protein